MATRKRKYSTAAQQLAAARPSYKKPRTQPPKTYNITKELKFFETQVNVSPVASTGTIPVSGSVVKIPQGTEENERIGRKCTIKSIHCRYQAELRGASNSSLQSDVLRIIMYLDKQANGAAAAVSDISETATWQTFNNLSNSGRLSPGLLIGGASSSELLSSC